MTRDIIILAWENHDSSIGYLWRDSTPASREKFDALYVDYESNGDVNVWLLAGGVPNDWRDFTLTVFIEADISLWLLGLATVPVPVQNYKPWWFDGNVVRSRIAKRYVSSGEYV